MRMNHFNNKTNVLKLALIGLFSSELSFGDLVTRQMEVPFFCNAATVFYLTLQNPSTAKQEVRIDFKIVYRAPGAMPYPPVYYYKEAGSHTGHNNLVVGAASSKPTSATTNWISLEAGKGTQTSIIVDGAVDAGGDWGCAATISVKSEKGAGFVLSDGIVTTSGTPHTIPINSGKPF